MVVAQLVKQLLPTPEVCGLNPVIGKIYIEHLFNVNCIEKMKIKKKSPEMAKKLQASAMLTHSTQPTGGKVYSFRGRYKVHLQQVFKFDNKS